MPDTVRASHAQYAMDVDQYVVLSTTLSVFLWQVLYAGVINFYLGYIVVLANCALLLARGTLVVHRLHVYFLAGLAAVSLLAAINTHNPARAMIAQLTGISVFSIYHYSVLHHTRFSLARVMQIYSGWATVAAIWGYPLWLYHKAQGEALYRFCSWFAEPSHYVYATLPAASYCLLKWHREKTLEYSSVPLLFSYVLADSSTAYVGIGITILLMADFRSIKRVLLAAGLCALGAYAAYNFSDNLQLRVNDTLNSTIKAEASNAFREAAQVGNPDFGANATTFALVTNGYVAWKAFLASPAIGNGLGTHSASYDKYSTEIVSPAFILWGLNKDDANSLALRLISELGIFGISAVIFLVIYFGRVTGSAPKLLRNAIIPYFIMRMIRFGAYFSLENFFFIMIYGFNFLQNRPGAGASGDHKITILDHAFKYFM
jgi:hypothetical protein